jgi:hypothetical protein
MDSNGQDNLTTIINENNTITTSSKCDTNGNKVSALEHNIKSKGEFSYYYAHGRKFENKQEVKGKNIEGPGIITGGPPVLLAKTITTVEVIKEPKKFTKYIFYDDDKYVQIKIDLPEEFKTSVTDNCIDIQFSEKSVDLKVIMPDREPYFYCVKKLAKKIIPDESKVRIFKGKVVISLKKKNEDEEWDKLQG